MMVQFRINEDKFPAKLFVAISSKITDQINAIHIKNKNNNEALMQWEEYLKMLFDNISNRSVAFDYGQRFSHYPNGAVLFRDFDSQINFIIKNSPKYGAYVYVFSMKLEPEKFGLKNPLLSENSLKAMIRECIREAIRDYIKNTECKCS